MEDGKKVSGQWLKWLEREVTAWQGEGLIGEGQAEAILHRYEKIRENDAQESSSKLVAVLAVIGALLLGIGVILFFAANWQAIPKVWKVALVFGSIIIAYAVGYYLAFGRENYPKVGRSLIFLGSILYGAGIWLIAQIFHISSHYPNGVLFWVLGIIPVVLVCRSLSVLTEAALLTVLWTIMEQKGFGSVNYLFLPLITVILLLSYYLKSRLAVGIALPGTVIWMGISVALTFKEFDGPQYVFLSLSLLGLMIYILGSLQVLTKKFAQMILPYKLVGLLAFLMSFYILSFKLFADGLVYFRQSINYPVFFLVSYAIITLSAGAASIVSLVKAKQNRELLKEGLFVLALVIILSILTFVMPFLTVEVFLAAVNLLLFAAIVALIIIGYSNRDLVLINMGLLFFVLDVIARYFDFFWDMLPKSVFFMVGGLLLLIGGSLLERNRRKIVREMRVKNYAA